MMTNPEDAKMLVRMKKETDCIVRNIEFYALSSLGVVGFCIVMTIIVAVIDQVTKK